MSNPATPEDLRRRAFLKLEGRMIGFTLVGTGCLSILSGALGHDF